MKTIIKNEKNVSFYILEDTTEVIMTEKHIKFLDIILLDMNSKNSSLIEDVLPIPEDWKSTKYMYILQNTKIPQKPWGWILNPEWIEPKKEDEV